MFVQLSWIYKKETNHPNRVTTLIQNSNQFKGRGKSPYNSPALLTINTTCYWGEFSSYLALMSSLLSAFKGFLEAFASAAFQRTCSEGVSYQWVRQHTTWEGPACQEAQGIWATTDNPQNVISHFHKHVSSFPSPKVNWVIQCILLGQSQVSHLQVSRHKENYSLK